MPNLWSKAGKFFSDEKGIKDEDYEKMSEKMENTESGMVTLKNLLRNFNQVTDPFCKYIKDLNSAIKKMYTDTPFQDFTDTIIVRQEKLLGDIDNLNKSVAKLFSKTSEWDTIFDQAKAQMKIREEKKKNFEHYEEKLKKMGKDTKKVKKEVMTRNEEKYSKASAEYVDISEKSFNLIAESIKLSLNLGNPIIGKLISEEQSFMNCVMTYLNDYSNIEEIFEDIILNKDPNAEEDEKAYDPTRFYREKTLMKRVSENEKLRASVATRQKKAAKPTKRVSQILRVFTKQTTSFGPVPEERWKYFMMIQDHPY